MFKSLSERSLRAGLGLSLAGIALAAAIFYPLQNSGALPGGQVAPLKLAWLGCAILFWYVLPALLLLDERISWAARLAVTILLANMVARAIIELVMMYVTKNWHPWLGIGHDVVSFFVMLVLTTHAVRGASRLYAGYLVVATSIFVPEAIFAWYMLENVGVPGEAVYFVPNDPAHAPIMLATAVCVALLVGYLAFFSRQWLYGQTEH